MAAEIPRFGTAILRREKKSIDPFFEHPTELDAGVEKISKELEALPLGSKVGFITFEEMYGETPDPLLEETAGLYRSRKYWDTLVAAALNSGAQVVFLEDRELLEKYLMRARALKELEENSAGSNFEALRSRKELRYRLQQEALYLKVFAREARTVELFRAHQPLDVVVENPGYMDDDLMGRIRRLIKDVKVKSFERVCSRFVRSPWDILGPVAVPYCAADENSMRERDLLLRRYNSIARWRILPNKKCDFIGTWDKECRTNGLFEIYNTPDGIKIEDKFGTAKCDVIVWSPEYVELIKEYDEQAIFFGGGKGRIVYKCWKTSQPRSTEHWDGIYNGDIMHGGFELYIGSKFPH